MKLPRWSHQVKETGGVHGNVPNTLSHSEERGPYKAGFGLIGRLSAMTFSLRKEVIQPQVLLRLPCYDFTPIMSYTLDGCLPCGSAHRLLVQPTFVM